APLYRDENPVCPTCGKYMKSSGQNQGFRCKKCGTQATSKIRCETKRNLTAGLYEVPPCARRHLAKPLVREQKSDIEIHPAR
ncbi:MAG TPA: tRNA(Ile2) 2-agmatinylcytidine synthetase, partial [Methanosarcina vacuolata]|nr:tRNA(Ile2) 2-agmatinylcytidine synthetase [Methanosarcina vacuolata]